MKVKCEYCESMFDDILENCPSCGAVNFNVRRSTEDQPTTIEGLQQWYTAHGLPPAEVTRFFIGENYLKPKAFGIYKDGDDFIVYKNKADGSRAIRYKGTDEAYAVNELHQRLKQEIVEQKARNASKNSATPYRQSGSAGGSIIKRIIKSVILFYVGMGVLSLVAAAFFHIAYPAVKDGYYKYGRNVYYHDSYGHASEWYIYDKYSDEWEIADDLPDALDDRRECGDFYYLSTWDSSTQVSDFSTADTAQEYHSQLVEEDRVYRENHSSSSDWSSSDSSYDWDSGSSWDSGGSDWDSDW